MLYARENSGSSAPGGFAARRSVRAMAIAGGTRLATDADRFTRHGFFKVKEH
ncbi:MAG: hypothetical protein WBN57_03570 [Gammaproteobacteria bacterium]